LTAGTPSQFELYDLVNDPLESHNMGDPANTAYFNPAKLAEMVEKLHRKMEEIDNHPFSVAARARARPAGERSPAPAGTE